MILKSISPENFGPFVAGTKLEVDPEVTVLTGPNDAGKSLALRAIELLCTRSKLASHEVNRNRVGEFPEGWQKDPEIRCKGTFELTTISAQKIQRQIQPQNPADPGSQIVVARKLTLDHGSIYEVINADKTSRISPTPFNAPPKILRLPLETEVRQGVDLEAMTSAESELLRIGFGPEFNLSQHQSVNEVDRTLRVREAEDRLNEHLKCIFPNTMPLEFRLTEIGDKAEQLAIGLVDQHKGLTPIGSRGAGVRKLLNVMGALLRVDTSDGNVIVLYDEPETSLHADAQHMLRRLLESLGSRPDVQVIYTTHSPAMINTLRPASIRVLERKMVNDKATSVFVNQPYKGNFSLVRSSLGISPGDSLLYAPITVVAEGATEILGIPLILNRLASVLIIDGDKLNELLPQTHFLNGEGAKYEYMCRLAKSQQAKPVLFLDGDKLNEIDKFKEIHPDVPIISLQKDQEFEDLVPQEIYIEAASMLVGGPTGPAAVDAFKTWESEKLTNSRLMLSKRVARWLEDEFNHSPSKPTLMTKAIGLTQPGKIDSGPFKELIAGMKTVSEGL